MVVKSKVSHTIEVILALHECGGCATMGELMKRLGLRRNYLHSYISYLRKKGIVSSKMVDGINYYCLEKKLAVAET
jgi:DNA-binding IscR family transcriptional regulator